MIQNLLELWYWIIVLIIIVSATIYFVICYAKDLWQIFKGRLDDKQPAVFAEKIMEPYSKRMLVAHWLTLVLLVIAWYLGNMLVDDRAEKSATMTGYIVHALIGGTVLVVTAMRMVYRSVDKMPRPVSNSLMDLFAREVHHALYLLLVLLPLTGFMTLLMSDVGVALVTANAKFLPEKYTGPSAVSLDTHDILMTVLMVVVAIHILGVIWHQFILKDGLISRMSLRRKDKRPA